MSDQSANPQVAPNLEPPPPKHRGSVYRRWFGTKVKSVRGLYTAAIAMPFGLFGFGNILLARSYWIGFSVCVFACVFLVALIFVSIEKAVARRIWTALALAGSAAALWIMYEPETVTVTMRSGPGDYDEQKNVYGIAWDQDYSELKLNVTNSGDKDVTGLDLLVTTDRSIVAAGVAPGVDGCTSQAATGNLLFTAEINITHKGKHTTIPFNDKGNPVASALYRIKCPRLSAKSVLEIKLATVARDPLEREPKEPPKWAVAWISYSAGARPVYRREEKCFVAPCDKLPAKIGDVRLDYGPTKSFFIPGSASEDSHVRIVPNKKYWDEALKSGP
jgi:hypothetical protein